MTVTRLTQVGVIIRHGNNRKITLMDPDGPRTRMASPAWGVSLRLKGIAAIVQCRIVLRLWRIKIQTWTLSGARRVMGAIRLLWVLCENTPTPANAAGRKQRVGTTGTPGRRNDTTRRSAVRPLLGEAVEFSPELAPEQKLLSGRKTRSSRAGGVVPSVVAEPPPPPPTDSGGGGGG